MDIALKFKRVVASLSAGAIFASLFVFGAGNASAQTFKDVPPTHPFGYTELEKAVELGIVDKNDNFRWADQVNRAEFMTMLSRTIDAKAGCTQPKTPTFKDMTAGAYYVEHIECLAQLGIVTGDTADNLATGFVRPTAPLVRAEAFALVVRAFELTGPSTPQATFSDIQRPSWYASTADIAYNNSIAKGDNGKYLPAKNIIRLESVVILMRALNPTPVCDPKVDPKCVPVPPPCPASDPNCVKPSTGDLEVSLSATTPKGGTIPLKANSVDVLCFDLSAPKDKVTVSSITAMRQGPGNSSDIDSAYLYEGENRLTSERTFSSDTKKAQFSLKNFVIDAGKKRNLCLVVDISDTAVSSSEHTFSIDAKTDVVNNAKSTVGNFPIKGNTFEIGAVAVSDVTVVKGGSISKAKLGGKNQTVANFKLTAGINDISLDRIALSNNGSLDAENLENCKLMRGSDELAMTLAPVGELITFKLAKPYKIDEGQSRNFDVTCDITGGKPAQTVELYVDGTTDLKATDLEFSFGANVINNFTQSDTNTVVIEGSAVTLLTSGPASTQIAQNSTNNVLMDYSVLTQLDLTALDTRIQIDLENGGGNGPDLNALGNTTVNGAGSTASFVVLNTAGFSIGDTVKVTATSGTVYAIITNIVGNTILTGLPVGDAVANGTVAVEVDPYSFVKNVKIIDTDTKDTLIDPIDTAKTNATLIDDAGVNNGPAAPHSYFKVNPQDYDFAANKERHLALMVDLDGNMPAGYKLCGQVLYANPSDTDSFFKDFESNSKVKTEDVVSTPLIGKCMTTAKNTLSVTKANTPTSNSFVTGEPAAPGLGISMTAGDSNDIRLNDLTVRVYADDTVGAFAGVAPFPGDIAANTVAQNISLYEGAKLITAQPESLKFIDLGAPGFTLGDYYVAEFEDLNLVIPSGDTRTLTAKVKIIAGLNATRFLALDVNPAEDIDAEDVIDQNTVVATGTSLNALAIKNPLLTIGNTGTLTFTSSSNPSADILLAGAQEKNVTNYTVKANDEAWTIDKITVINDLVGAFDLPTPTAGVSEVVIEYPDKNNVIKKKAQAISNTGEVTFSGLDFFVPAGNNNVNFKVYANLNTINGGGLLTSGSKVRLGIRDAGNGIATYNAVGFSSANTVNTVVPNNNTTPNIFVVRQNAPVFTQNTSPVDLTNSAGAELFDFNIKSEGASSLDVARMVFDVNLTDADSGTLLDLSLGNFKLERNGLPVNLANYNVILANGDVDLKANNFTTGNLPNVTRQVIVSFNVADPIQALTSFKLKADVSGVETNDSISIKLSDNDESVEAAGIIAGPNTNANTGELVDLPGSGIYTAPLDFTSDLAGDVGVNIASDSFIWSDGSDENHVYSTVANGSSDDFTNGFLTGINAFDSVIQSKE